ncbi:MAG: SOS response-associated peptidase family protein [Bdellovibrionota bacterium]
MCYSARIKTAVKELSWEFRAQVDLDDFEWLFTARLKNPELKIPFGLDRYFLLSQDAAEAKLAKPIREFYADEKNRNSVALNAAEAEIKEWRSKKPTATGTKKIGVLERRIAKLAEKAGFDFDRISPLDDRIYPFYFAPVITEESGQRKLRPMRYRVQNPDGTEVPSQYNVFNARHDSLMHARTWKPLFGKTHLIFPFIRFYEWVTKDGKKQEIYFVPEGRDMMWAAGIYTFPKNKTALPIHSFAMVTDDPPPEVAAAGHDRCPVFLQNAQLEAWLNPKNKTPEELLLLLRSVEKAFYLHGLAA